MRKLLTLLFLYLTFLHVSLAQTTLVPFNSSWKYLDNGSDQGTAWKETGFNDFAWSSGNAKLGYGNDNETTKLSYGPNASAKYLTTYFRKAIQITDASLFSAFSLKIRRDDGIVMYINGTERYRNNMPSGNISYLTKAASTCSDDGRTTQSATLPAGSLVSGHNVIAVEIHQAESSSSDIAFDLELMGINDSTSVAPVTLVRGPYLQMGTASSVVIRWRTSIPTGSRVKYGLSAGSLTATAGSTPAVTEHEVKLTGLKPNTRYYYSIGSASQILQGDADNFFVTAPPVGTPKRTRIWVTGDCGNNSTNQKNVRDRYQSYRGTDYTHVWLLLGDNAYSKGKDTEYQNSFFNLYKDRMLKQTVLWPAPGNHDYGSDSYNRNAPYYSIFSLPTQGESGGVASGSEAYYSYNYANIHFVSLDSYGKENETRLYDTLGPQVTWLKKDLAANTQKWTVVYWHHPPYTMGSHNSDTESDLVKIRQNFLRILERYKVDLVLCGHSHAYERSRLMQGHFGSESSFSASTHHLSTSSGRYDGTPASCPYVKNASSSYNGTVYVVAGSAGQLGGTQATWPHAAMEYANASNGGSLSIDVEDNRLDAKWICADGNIRDRFTLFKDVNKTTQLTITKGQAVTLKASWLGNYRWKDGATTRSITVTPAASTSYTVRDVNNCVTDVFNVTVKTAAARMATEEAVRFEMEVFPNPTQDHTTINYVLPQPSRVTLAMYDAVGNQKATLLEESKEAGSHSFRFEPGSLSIPSGVYLLKLHSSDGEIVQRIVLNR
jgi:hypothetical protein